MKHHYTLLSTMFFAVFLTGCLVPTDPCHPGHPEYHMLTYEQKQRCAAIALAREERYEANRRRNEILELREERERERERKRERKLERKRKRTYENLENIYRTQQNELKKQQQIRDDRSLAMQLQNDEIRRANERRIDSENARIAREQEARRASENNARIAREQAARRASENTYRKAAAEAARVAREKAAKRATENARKKQIKDDHQLALKLQQEEYQASNQRFSSQGDNLPG